MIRKVTIVQLSFFAILCSLCILNSQFSRAQQVISVKVTNEAGSTLPGVQVMLDDAASSMTDETGICIFTNVKEGAHTIEASISGFKEYRQSVTAGKEGEQQVHISLKENKQEIDNVLITGKSELTRIKEQSYNVTVVDAKKLYNTSSDINQVLNRTTGVRVRESGGLGSDFNFSINGFSGNQVKFFLDGVPITNYGPALTLNNIPINIAERIEVYKGVVPVGLGSDALGGAVNIITNKKIRKYIDASYSFGSFNTHRASVNGRYTTEKGFTLNLNSFYNYSDNNYKITVSVADTNGKFLPEKKYPHFHDAYYSAGAIIEGGITGKKYADYLLIGVIASANRKETQQGRNMQNVVGEAFEKSVGIIPTLKYAKDNLFIKGLSFNLSASYNIGETQAIDTSSKVYNWTGNYTYRQYGNTEHAGEIGDKNFSIFKERNLVTVANLAYNLMPHHVLTLNYTLDDFTREEEDRYKPKRLGLNTPTIAKNMLGLAYKADFFDEQVSFTAFGKFFGLRTAMVIDDSVNLSESRTNYGYGIAATWFILENLQMKGSFEKAYRLPTAEEMLGNGLDVNPNPLLKPENSNNINIGFSFNQRVGSHLFGIDATGIYRNATDFMGTRLEGRTSFSDNFNAVRVTGIEGNLRYRHKSWLNFEVGCTYQRTLDMKKYSPAGTLTPNDLYKTPLPNIPILFGNADLTFSFTKIVRADDNFSVNIGSNYLGDFYLYPAPYGSRDEKKTIPRQFTQDIGLTYSLMNGRYNINAECRNITDVRVYDYFKVQKPGRAVSVKFRYFFSK